MESVQQSKRDFAQSIREFGSDIRRTISEEVSIQRDRLAHAPEAITRTVTRTALNTATTAASIAGNAIASCCVIC